MALTNKKAILLVLVILFVSFLFLPAISLRIKTFGAVINLLIPTGKWRPLEILTQRPTRDLYEIKSTSGRTLTVNIYIPKNKKGNAGMVVYTPFIGGGLDDPRLVNLANTFSKAGFVVAIPSRSQEQQIISTKDVEDIISTALFLKNRPGLNIEKIGLFGISYGNGPVIIASVNSQIKDFINFVISFAGYYDLQNALDFIRTGEFAYKDIKGKAEPQIYAKEILSKTIVSHNMSEEEFLKSSTLDDLKKNLSPSSVAEIINADFFITHSTDDSFIPYTESLRLSDALRDKVPVWFALNTAFEHGEYKKLNFENLRRHYLPSFITFYDMLRILLSKHL